MKLNKILAAILAAGISTTTFSHTNSVGYVGDGAGGLNFWYGNWHSNTTFNEAEIKMTKPDSTTRIDAFSLLSQTTPAGLIPGVNYFSSDGTGLVAYGSNTQRSSTWQGINYTGLSAGTYTFKYIPLGDAESTLGAGLTPTANWAPMDNVIRTLSITLTAGDLNGDANNNGIPDIQEVPAGGGSAPTVVSQGSNSIMAYTAVSGSSIQTVYRARTNTTWDNMSDGTTQNTQSTTTNLDNLVGRVDQMATADRMLSMVNRNLSFNGVNIVGTSDKMKNGMTGGVSGLTLGGTRDLEHGWYVGAGVGRLNARVRNDGTADVTSNLVNINGGVKLDEGTVNMSLTRAMNSYISTRTIGDFANSSSTKGTDTWANATFTGNGEEFRPVLGLTRGLRKINGYTELGDIQTARTLATDRDWYTFGTLGAEATIAPGINLQALHHTDGVNSLVLLANKEIEDDITLTGKVIRNVSREGNSNSFVMGLIKKF